MSNQASIDVTEIMQEIRRRAMLNRRGNDVESDASLEYGSVIGAAAKVKEALFRVETLCSRLDDLPPQPNTLRGRIGAVLSRMVHRALFWQNVQARTIATAMAEVLKEAVAAIEETEHQLVQARARESEVVETAQRTQKLLGKLDQSVARLEDSSTSHSERLEQLELRFNRVDNTLQDLAIGRRLDELDRYARQTRRETTLQSARVSMLSKQFQLSGRIAPDPANPSPKPRATDAIYLAFEDAFRGDPGEIRQRVSAYLPVLAEYGVQPDLGPALDIGCGRGEWLDVIATAGYQAKGCDADQQMVELCRRRGLNVELTDGLSYLQTVPDDSLAIVSAFHVIEHIPIEAMIELLDASLAALKPGGILLLESPNPQNAIVATHNFYLDPTHQRPVPMALTQFLVESRGFCDVRAFGLHPYPSSIALAEDSEVARRFNEFFYGAQDYAVTARKI
jgi:SAM-dependent methyltransferase